MSALQAVETWRWTDDGAESAKSIRPLLPRHWIRRDRLDRQLSEAAGHPLTIVTGGSGMGKTVLLADWAGGGAQRLTAWLSLEVADNDPQRFWGSIVAALGVDGIDQRGWFEYQRRPHHEWFVDLLALRLAGEPARVLIIDNFHVITDAIVIGALARLAHSLPSHLRLVLAGHEPVQLPLRQLQSSGAVATLSHDDLRFTVDEAAALITLVAGKLIPNDDLTVLTEQCEGCAAGLYLAAQALKDQFGVPEHSTPVAVRPPTVQGSWPPAQNYDRYVVEPLTDREREVLVYLPTHLSQRDIAAALYVSINTVKSHVKAIYRKIGAASRAEAVAIARAHGLV